MDKYEIPFINACIKAFGQRFSLPRERAYAYLKKFSGMQFLYEFYDVEHLQSIKNTVDDLIVNDNLSLDQAMDMVYSSDTIKKLQNVEGELFVQSPDYVYELFKKEYRIDSNGDKDIVADPMPLY